MSKCQIIGPAHKWSIPNWSYLRHMLGSPTQRHGSVQNITNRSVPLDVESDTWLWSSIVVSVVVLTMLQFFSCFLFSRHVHLWPVPRPWWLLPGGMQSLWPGGEATGLWEALWAETWTTGQAPRSTALAHPCLPASAAPPPQPLSIARDQPHFCFVLGGS